MDDHSTRQSVQFSDIAGKPSPNLSRNTPVPAAAADRRQHNRWRARSPAAYRILPDCRWSSMPPNNESQSLLLVGDSSGAALALATAMRMRDESAQLTSIAVVGLSPMLDMSAAVRRVYSLASDAIASQQSRALWGIGRPLPDSALPARHAASARPKASSPKYLISKAPMDSSERPARETFGRPTRAADGEELPCTRLSAASRVKYRVPQETGR